MDDCHSFQLKSADGTRLHACQWDAAHPVATLVLVHGFGEHSGRYQPMADYLTDRGVQVIAADMRGHGRSEGKRGVIRHYDDFRTDLAALLDRARTVHTGVAGPLVLFGHSMGGGIVLDHGLSGQHGVDAIIASAPLITLADPIPKPVEALVRGLSKFMPKAAMKQPIVGEKISTLPEEQAKYVDDALNHGHMGLGLAVGMVDTGRAIANNAAQWSVPALVYHSDQDELTDFESSRAFAKNAGTEFRHFTDVAHEMHNDTTRPVVYAMLTEFIESLPRPT